MAGHELRNIGFGEHKRWLENSVIKKTATFFTTAKKFWKPS